MEQASHIHRLWWKHLGPDLPIHPLLHRWNYATITLKISAYSTLITWWRICYVDHVTGTHLTVYRECPYVMAWQPVFSHSQICTHHLNCSSRMAVMSPISCVMEMGGVESARLLRNRVTSNTLPAQVILPIAHWLLSSGRPLRRRLLGASQINCSGMTDLVCMVEASYSALWWEWMCYNSVWIPYTIFNHNGSPSSDEFNRGSKARKKPSCTKSQTILKRKWKKILQIQESDSYSPGRKPVMNFLCLRNERCQLFWRVGIRKPVLIWKL